MKITAQEEYGLRCVLGIIKLSENKGTVQVPQIAQFEGLSIPYVEKLLRIMSKNGLVESVRGAKGGYRLTAPVETLSLGDVMRSLGEVPNPDTMCKTFIGSLQQCAHHDSCGVRPVWSHVAAYLNAFFDSIPLMDLLESDHTPRIEKLQPASAYKRRDITAQIPVKEPS